MSAGQPRSGGATWLLCMFACASAASANDAAELTGRPVREALAELRRAGLHLLYGSDLVTPDLLVHSEPVNRVPIERARELLVPHGLTLVPGPAGRWLVARLPQAAAESNLVPRAAESRLDEIVVTAGRYAMGDVAGRQTLTRNQIARTPHIADDPLRVIRQLPGITGTDFSANLHVRGGARDETAILVDGVRIFDPFHLKNFSGALGVIDAGIVESVDIMTGGFGAEYGDRMSGIVAMRTLDPAETPETTMGVSFVNAFVRSRGPMDDGRGHWMLSVRRGYLDWLFKLIDSSGDFTPRYWDVFAKADHALGDATVLTGSGLFARDELRYVESSGALESSLGDADSAYVWLSASTRWSAGLQSDTVFSYSGVERARHNADQDLGLSSQVDDWRDFGFWALRSDWRWQAGQGLLMRFGGEVRYSSADYDYARKGCLARPFPSGACVDNSFAADLTLAGESYALYASARWELLPGGVLDIGLRADRQTFAGVADDQLSPRLGLAWNVGERGALTLSAGAYYQSQQPEELAVEDGETSLAPAEHARQYAVTFSQGVGEYAKWRAELYEKRYRDLRLRYENLFDSFEVVSESRPDRVGLRPQDARVRGASFSFETTFGDNVEASLTYGWQQTRDRFSTGSAPRSWDESHSLIGSLSWEIGAWTMGAFATARAGWPTTPLTVQVTELPSGLYIESDVGERNSLRLPTYARVDLRFSRVKRFPNGDLSYFLELYNATNRSNRCCADEVKIYPDGQGGWVTRPAYDDWLPLLPSFGFTYTFR